MVRAGAQKKGTAKHHGSYIFTCSPFRSSVPYIGRGTEQFKDAVIITLHF